MLYWPGLNQAVSEVIQSCEMCLEHRSKQAPELLIPHEVTSCPRVKIGVDLCVHGNDNYLVICDYFSNFPEVLKLRSTSTTAVVNGTKHVFGHRGVCKECFPDNGPQFSSEEFRSFAQEYGFTQNVTKISTE